MDYTREDWERIGLLEGVSEDRKEMVSHAMTKAFNWIDQKSDKSEQDIPGFQHEVLPLEVVRRIAISIDLTDREIIQICEDVGPAHDKYDFSQFGGYDITAECEFQFTYCDGKIEELKNKIT